MSLFDRFTNKSKSEGQGKVICLLNQKGGVGKTTMAFNLAHALKDKGKKVLCLDMDPQSNLSLLFGIEDADPSIHHLLINSIKELRSLHSKSALAEAIIKKDGIDILPCSQELSGFELTVAGISAPRQLILKKFIEKNGLKEFYDYIVIDGPPTLGLLVVNILCAAHGVLVPFQPDQFSRSGLEHFHGVLEDVEDMGITQAPKVIGYIPNLVEKRRKQTESDFENIQNDLGESKIFTGFSNRAPIARSSAQRKSVFDFSSKEYRELQEQFKSMVDSIEEGL